MPPVALAAGITGIAGLAGAGINAISQNKAANSQAQANAAALQFEREKEANRLKQYQQAQQMYGRQWDYWNALRGSLAQHLGISLPEAGSLMGDQAGGQAGGAVPGPVGGQPGGDLLRGVPNSRIAEVILRNKLPQGMSIGQILQGQ